MKSNRTEIVLGQPIELTITAQYLNLSPALLYTLAGSGGFRLKLLLPEGFIRTGGDYADLVSTELPPSNAFVRYTVTGYFTQVGAENTFRLLRSHSNADQTSLFVEKARVSLTLVNSAEPVRNRQARESADNPANGNYEGHFDGANCDNFWGWVYDRNNPNAPITVEVVANGQVVGSFSASNFRQDLLNAGKGNGQHGFNYAPPASIKNGQNQSISLRVQGSSFTLEQGPRTVQCAGSGSSGGTTTPPTNPGTPPTANNPSNGNYEGHFEGADCGNLGGWVYDRNNPNAPITVEVVAIGQVVGSFTAANFRQDLLNAGKGNGQHGFNYAPPASIKNGQNQLISLRVQGSSFTLEQGPRTIQCAGSGSSGGTTTPPTNPGTTTPPPSTNPSNGNYEGNFEGADCGNLGGWVYDRNNPNAPITVEVVANGQVVSTFPAANFRQDLLNAGKGNGQHGFNFAPPESIKNGQNQSISLRVQGSSYTLNNSPKTIQCAGSGSSGGTGSNPGTSTPETGNCSVENPKGHLDNATMYSVGGWALDENNLNKTVLVDIFVNGIKLATVEANEDRPDLVGAFGNNPAARYHGFSAEFGLSGVGNGIGTVTTRICGSTTDLPTSINRQVNFRSDFIINPYLFPLTIDGGTLKVFVLIKAKRPSDGDAGGPTGPAGPAVGVGGPATAGGSGSGSGSGNGSNEPLIKYPYKLKASYEKKYPKFTNVLRNLRSKALSNARIKNAIKKFTGLTDAQIQEKLTYGQGPELVISTRPQNTDWGHGGYKYGEYDSDPYPKQIWIDEFSVEMLERGQGLTNLEEAYEIFLSMLVVHEFAHFGQTETNIIDTVHGPNGQNDTPGSFNIEAFGVPATPAGGILLYYNNKVRIKGN
ncbi:hypothetical protein [Larkinella sp. C7]|jgi:hypothetical protein|uniref:hypothetical protein n=1 Tax=Larkinella sp. C7 TaxID=2576607 RepID=UPI001485DEBC|nr:hypothetical protein [Larkinella sp. C7]